MSPIPALFPKDYVYPYADRPIEPLRSPFTDPLLSTTAQAVRTLMQIAQKLNLNFLNTQTLDPRIAFTRATPATRFNSQGVLETLGYNLMLWSMMNAGSAGTGVYPTGWLRTGTDDLVNTTSLSGGYNGQGYISFRRTASAGFCGFQRGAADVAAVTTTTVSVYVRMPTGATACDLSFYAGGGTPSTTTLATAATLNAQAKDVWVRYSATITFTVAPDANGFINPSTGTVGQGWDISAPQIELGSTLSAYSPTTTVANSAPRFDYDPATPASYGTELAPNGGVMSSFSGFNAVGTGWSISGGRAVYNAGGGYLELAVPTVPGQCYTVNFGNDNNAFCGVWANPGQAANIFTSGGINIVKTFIAVGTTSYIGWSGGAAFNVSNISVKQTSFTPRGLLIEEARTNNCQYSNSFSNWTNVGPITIPQGAVGPDGAASAWTFTRTLTSSSYTQTQLVSKAASALPYTFSCFVKKGTAQYCALRIQGLYPSRVDVVFDLNNNASQATAAVTNTNFTAPTAGAVNCGNGWWRLWVQATTDTTASVVGNISFNANNQQIDGVDSSATSSGILFGCQLEAGAFPTSYIPTTTASATRNADSATMTGAGFSWYNAAAGSLVAEYVPRSPASNPVNQYAVSISDNTLTNRLSLFRVLSSGYEGVRVLSGNVASLTFNDTISVAADSISKMAVAYGGASSIGAINAVLTTSGTSTAPVTPSQLALGQSDILGSAYLNGHIRRIAYYNTRLTDAQLQALTT